MRKIEVAHEILSESRRSTQVYLESGRDYDKVKSHMYSIFECYAHGLITWNQVRSRWHSSILEYLNLYASRPDLYLSESNRMLGEYENTLNTFKPALDEYKRVTEQKMTSNIVVKGKLNESQAKEQSNVYFNRRALKESELKDTVTMKTWKRVQESYPNLTSKDELRIRMLTVFEGSTVDTTKLVTTYMSEEPTAISGPMQTSLRPKPRPTNLGNVDSASIDSAVQQALGQTSPRPMPRPAGQSIGAGSQVAYMDNGAVDGSTRGIDPADAYSPEDLARLTGQPAPSLAPKTSPRPMPRPTTLKQSANNNIRKEAAAIFDKIKVAANEGYKVLPPMDKERYTEIPGLEGPFTTLSGKVVYYDPKEGAYYDRDSDMYLSNDEYTALNSDYSGMQDERDIKVREAKAKPGHNARVMANNLSKVFKAKPDFLDMDKDGNKKEPMKKAVADSKKKVDEKAKWRSSSAAKKITDPDKDLGMADYDYHHENPRSTGRLKSTADTEPSDGSINNRAKSKTNSMGKRKGMVSKADINRVKSNAFNTLNKDKVDEAPLLGPQGKIHRAASADQSDREYAAQRSFKDAWTAKNVGKKWPGYAKAGFKSPYDFKEESAVKEAQSSANPLTKNNNRNAAQNNMIQKVTFVGPNSTTWDTKAAQLAANLEQKGVSREEIWRKTGTVRSTDGEWRQELSDDKASIDTDRTLNPEGDLFPLGEYYKHDELFNAYPGLKDWNILVKDMPEKEWAGVTMGKTDNTDTGNTVILNLAKLRTPEDILDTITHEVNTHVVQSYEPTFAPGGSSTQGDNLNKLNPDYKPNAGSQLSGSDFYQAMPDEQLARTTQDRRTLTPAQRQARFPNIGGDSPMIMTPGSKPPAGTPPNSKYTTLNNISADGRPVYGTSPQVTMRTNPNADLKFAHPNFMDYKNNPEILNAYEKLKTKFPSGVLNNKVNDMVAQGNIMSQMPGQPAYNPTATKQLIDIMAIGNTLAKKGWPSGVPAQVTPAVKPPVPESAVNEAVTLDYSRYVRAHGKKPRDAGMGSSTWMFTTAEFGDPSEDEIFQFQGSFADAKKAAAKWAKSQGEYRFYVME